MHPRLNTTITSLALVALLTSCAPGSSPSNEVTPKPGARAILDQETSTVRMPIDSYIPNHEEARDLSRAAEKAVNNCLKAAGHEPTPKADTGSNEDRRFGLWNIERAKLYGFGLKGDSSEISGVDSTEEMGQPREECLVETADETKKFDVASMTQPGGTNATEIRDQAAEFLREDPLWSEMKKSYDSCLSDQGLTPLPDEWGSAQSDEVLVKSLETDGNAGATEEEIRIAVLEAQCNSDLEITQQLSDREAGYQQTLIEQNEATLAKEQEQKDEAVEAARRYLAEG